MMRNRQSQSMVLVAKTLEMGMEVMTKMRRGLETVMVATTLNRGHPQQTLAVETAMTKTRRRLETRRTLTGTLEMMMSQMTIRANSRTLKL